MKQKSVKKYFTDDSQWSNGKHWIAESDVLDKGGAGVKISFTNYTNTLPILLENEQARIRQKRGPKRLGAIRTNIIVAQPNQQ